MLWPRSVAHLIGFCLLLLFCSLFYPLFTTLFLFGFDYFVFIYICVFTLSVFLFCYFLFPVIFCFSFFVMLFRFARQSFVSFFLSHLILFRGFLHKIRFLYFVLSVYFPIKTKMLSVLSGCGLCKTENLTDTNTLNGTFLSFFLSSFLRHTKSNEIFDCLRYWNNNGQWESNGK